jgi:hypothetical protein
MISNRPIDNPRNDPWLYECKATKNTLHYWSKNSDGTSVCKKCGVVQTTEQTNRCFTEY